MTQVADGPLQGFVVLDLSRMLPGAVLARQLIDLGARLIKVEDPETGDLMRHVPPLSGGIGVGFATFLRGAESVCLDLRSPEDAARLRQLAGRADVLVESFRPGTMERWGLGPDRLHEDHPDLVWCSLSAFGRSQAGAGRVGHDLNLSAVCGALPMLGSGGVPRIRLADITGGLLAATAIVGALLKRQRGGGATVIDQPLVTGPLPFLTWTWAEAGALGVSVVDSVLGGLCPCYRTYRCRDGRDLALGALEPKLWLGVVELLDLPEHAAAGLDLGDEGERAARAVSEAFASQPREHWLALAEERGLPLSPVHDVEAAHADPFFGAAGLTENTPMPDGSHVTTPGPYLPSLGRTPERPAPHLGEHTEAVMEEFGVER